MKYIDVFNGDADGICSLVQLRWAEPRRSELITGVKRDIQLLDRIIHEHGRYITVLDISLASNRAALDRLLSNDNRIHYFDHHESGMRPDHVNLTAYIDEDPNTSTALLVNTYLKGKYARWAVVGAFGDNQDKSARLLAGQCGLSDQETEGLRRLGVCINYNGYGESLNDLHYSPKALYEKLACYSDPRDLLRDDSGVFRSLESVYADDMANAVGVSALPGSTDSQAVFILPCQPWARRVNGVLGNHLTNIHPQRAHAILVSKRDGHYAVSVRAPQTKKQGALSLCKQFKTGGGRAAAAGINDLPARDVDAFVAAFRQHCWE